MAYRAGSSYSSPSPRVPAPEDLLFLAASISIDRLARSHRHGDTHRRTLLIHGARPAIVAARRQSESKNLWLANLLNRRHPNIVAVALANKNVCTVWALLTHGRDFNPGYAPVRAAA